MGMRVWHPVLNYTLDVRAWSSHQKYTFTSYMNIIPMHENTIVNTTTTDWIFLPPSKIPCIVDWGWSIQGGYALQVLAYLGNYCIYISINRMITLPWLYLCLRPCWHQWSHKSYPPFLFSKYAIYIINTFPTSFCFIFQFLRQQPKLYLITM